MGLVTRLFARACFALGGLAGLLGATPGHAQNAYNSNAAFKITQLLAYTESDDILFAVDATPPLCGPYFVIPGEVPSERRQQLLARLLTAYSSGERINIGYDGATCGPLGYFRVFRVG